MAIIVLGAVVVYGWARGPGLAALVFCQPFIILYAVYWRGSRFDVASDSVVKFFFIGFAVARPLFVLLENLVKHLPFATPTEAIPFLFLVSAVLEEFLKYYVAASTAVPSPYPKGAAVPRTARRKACAVYYIALACGYAGEMCERKKYSPPFLKRQHSKHRCSV